MSETEATGKNTENEKDDDTDAVSLRSIELNPNGDKGANSAGKSTGNMKPIEASECGSSTVGPLENDAYRRWKEMKRNGFLSSSHGGIPVPDQTQRLKKRKIEELKKKKTDPIKKQMEIEELKKKKTDPIKIQMEIEELKKKKTDPIKKQMEIEEVKKKKNDPLKKQMEIAKREQIQRFTKIAAPSGLLSGLNPGIINHVRNSKQVHSIIEALVRSERHESSKKGENWENTLHKGGCNNTAMAERRFYDETFGASQLKSDETCGALQLSSSLTTTSNEDVSNESSVSSLSARAATVASEWLELLYHDIKGRLAALRRSKKRIQAVIETELPFLVRKEFSSGKCPNSALSDMHRARWAALFGQMEKALAEEGSHLENWLNQVKEMQLQCDKGLNFQNVHSLGRSEILPARSSMMEASDSVLALRAAAASIYSTCNFVKATGVAQFHV